MDDATGPDKQNPTPSVNDGDSGADATDDGADCGSGDVVFRVPVAAEAEDSRCIEVRLPEGSPRRIGAIRSRLFGMWHHVVVYRSTSEDEKPRPFPCEPFAVGENPPLLLSQLPAETLTLPEGVAFGFSERQIIRIELHVFNPTAVGGEACADVSFLAADEGADTDADFLFYADADISLPPGEATSVGPAWLAAPAGTRLFALTGHTHGLGTRVSIARSRGEEDEGELLYDAGDDEVQVPEWPVEPLDPPREMEEGDGLRFSCDFFNSREETVTFGTSASSEMCGLYGYYYPSRGFLLCVTARLAGGAFCCPDPDVPACAAFK